MVEPAALSGEGVDGVKLVKGDATFLRDISGFVF